MPSKDPLKDWRKTTLWLRVLSGPLTEEQTGPLVKVNVWHPQDISENERVALLAKHASQTVSIIKQLTGTTQPIVQGQYKDEQEEPSTQEKC